MAPKSELTALTMRVLILATLFMGACANTSMTPSEEITTTQTTTRATSPAMNGTITYSNGTTVFPDGTIQYPDGTTVHPDGTTLYPDGETIFPDGSVIYPNGTFVYANGTVMHYPNGTMVYPDGTIQYPDGTMIHPDGTTLYPDGETIFPDGSVIYPNGTFVYANGTVMHYPNGTMAFPDGSIHFANGTIVFTDGTVMYPNGLYMYPNGTMMYPPNVTVDENGTVTYPDGTVYHPDGTMIYTDGSVYFPNGTMILSDGTISYPNGKYILSDGSVMYANGTMFHPNGTLMYHPNGTFTLPDGTTYYPNGTVMYSDGTIIYPSGKFVYPDGSVIFANGTYMYPNGTMMHPHNMTMFDNGTMVYPDGSIHYANGTVVNPDGSVLYPNGAYMYPNGTMMHPQNMTMDENGTIVYPDGSIHYANGTVVNPDGSVIYPNGAYMYPNGTMMHPQNMTMDENGTMIYPDGSIHYANGTIVNPDGSVLYPNGAYMYPNGTMMHPQNMTMGENGTMLYPDGSIHYANGTIVNPDGSVLYPNGAYMYPNGTMMHPQNMTMGENGTMLYPDGSIHYANGTIVNPDGSVLYPNGAYMYPNGTMMHPQNMTMGENGTMLYPDGSIHYANGTIVNPDGSVLYPNGAYMYPNGTMMHPQNMTMGENGTMLYPDGSIHYANGTIVNPDGSVLYPNGAYMYPNGTMMHPQNMTMYENETMPPYLNGTMPPYLNGTMPPTLNGTMPPYLNGTMPPTLNGTMPPYLNETMPPYLNGTMPPTLNGTMPPYLNGTMPPYMNGTMPPYMNDTMTMTPSMDMSMYSSHPTMAPSMDMSMSSSHPSMTPSMDMSLSSSHPIMTSSMDMSMSSSHLTMMSSMDMSMSSSHPTMTPSMDMSMSSSHPTMTPSMDMLMSSSHPTMTPSMDMSMSSSHPTMTPSMDMSMSSSHPTMTPSMDMSMSSSHTTVTPSMDMSMSSSHPTMTPSMDISMSSSHPTVTPSMDMSMSSSHPTMTPSMDMSMSSSMLSSHPGLASTDVILPSSTENAPLSTSTTLTTPEPITYLKEFEFSTCFHQRYVNYLNYQSTVDIVHCTLLLGYLPDLDTLMSNITVPYPDWVVWGIYLQQKILVPDWEIAPPNCLFANITGATDSEILSNLQSSIEGSITYFRDRADAEVDSALTCGTAMLESRASEFTAVMNSFRANASVQHIQAVTYFEAVKAAMQEVSGCSGLIDCAGVCNGFNIYDVTCDVCFGLDSNYTTEEQIKDCHGVCFGSAALNECGECYGGTTGRTADHGVDSCNGQCTLKPGYVNNTDCNNVCNGTAYIDSCSAQCVGGNTGKSADDFRDCNGICNGDGTTDTCGFCVASGSLGSTGSPYKDCNGDCYTPATLSNMATTNECGVCVGGQTGRTEMAGKDACGVCGGNNSTCLDCEGVPNGGKVVDACGVCGGPGTSCLAVASTIPDYLPSGTAKSVEATGAGLSPSSLECVMVNQATSAETPVTDRTPSSAQLMTLTVPALTPGSYKLACRQATGQSLSDNQADIVVYDSSGTTVTAVTPSSFTLTGGTQMIQVIGSGFVAGHTYCHITVGSAAEVVMDATVVSGTSASCTVAQPPVSSQILVSVSLNLQDKLTTTTTLTATAPPPALTAAFTDSGDAVGVTFDREVDTTSLSGCSAIFQDVTSLGANAICTFQSRTLLIIEDTSAALNAVLMLKPNVIKAYGEDFATASSGSVTLAKGANPVRPVGSIRGSSQVGACSDIKVDALLSTGGGGRSLTYTWTVSPDSGLTKEGDGTAELSLKGTQANNNYVISLSVCNFLGECDNTKTLTVSKLATVIPEVFITANRDINNIRLSDRVELSSNAKLSECQSDTLQFTWSFSDSRVTLNRQNTRDYVISPGDLPPDASITATVTVNLASDTSTTVQATILLQTVSVPPVALIIGAKAITIGTTSGNLVLDGSESYDPDGTAGSLVYEWSCTLVTEGSGVTGCLDGSGSQLVTTATGQTSTLTLATSRLVVTSASQTYKFKLTVSKNSRTASEEVRVSVIDGNPPKVLFRDVGTKNKVSVDDIVTVTAVIESTTPVTAEWAMESLNGYGYIDLSDAENLQTDSQVTESDSNYIAVLSIKPGKLQRRSKYSLAVNVTDQNGKTSRATTEIYVYNGVTSCSATAPASYSELSEVSVEAENCYSDEDGLPLTFSLYRSDSDGDTGLQLASEANTGNFHLSSGPRADASGVIIFAMKVCAQFGGCAVFMTGQISVNAISAAQLTAIRTSVVSNVEKLKQEGNVLTAALQLMVYFDKANEAGAARKRRSVETHDRIKRSVVTSDIVRLQLDLVQTALTNVDLQESVANTLIAVMSVIPIAETSDSDMTQITSHFVTLLTYYQSNKLKMSSDSVLKSESWLIEVEKRAISGDAVTQMMTLLKKTRRLGYQLYESSIFSLTSATRKFMFVIPKSGHTAKETDGLRIDFGDTLTKRFAQWSCSTGTCEGVGVEVTTSNTDTDPYSSDTTRATDVVDIVVVDPKSGEDITDISGLAIPVTLTFTISKSQGQVAYVCRYWNSGNSGWDTTGVSTSLQTSTQVVCKTNHLTPFAAFAGSAVVSTDNTGLIVGCVVGAVILLVIIIVVVVFVVKRGSRMKRSHRLITPVPAPNADP